MSVPRFRTAALAVVATLTLSACYDDGYGYGGLAVGYDSPGYYGSYYDDYYGYPSYYGWYDGFYYPGTGYWMYDHGGRRHRWDDHHRRYWEGRRGDNWRDHRDHWDGFHRDWRGDGGGHGRDWRRDGGDHHRDWRGHGGGGAAVTPQAPQGARPERVMPRQDGRAVRRAPPRRDGRVREQ